MTKVCGRTHLRNQSRSASQQLRRGTGPAAKGLGAFTTRNGSDPERKAQQVRSVATMNDYFGNIRRLGAAALDICMVAEGTQDAYAEYGIQEHDWAAGAVIAEEVGVPVRRPASADGATAPDWCIIGNIGMTLNELEPTPTQA